MCGGQNLASTRSLCNYARIMKNAGQDLTHIYDTNPYIWALGFAHDRL